MVINNRGPSQSALEHYVEYFLKDCGKVWQWSCPAHLRQRLAGNLQETSIGAGVIKSSPRDKVADWPCSNCWEAASCCSVFAFLPHASSLHLELPQHAGMAEGWQVGCGAGKVPGSISFAAKYQGNRFTVQRGWPRGLLWQLLRLTDMGKQAGGSWDWPNRAVWT